MSRRLTMLGVAALVGLLTLSAVALAKTRDRLTLKVPGKTTENEAFPVHLSGVIVSPANTLVYYTAKSACPLAYTVAEAAPHQPGAEQYHGGTRGRRFSLTIEPTDTEPGIYHVCAYLIYGHRTYARATGQTDTVAL
jgi:hypothetical protein